MLRQYISPAPEKLVQRNAKSGRGDGIRMAQELGAQLWHMWHFHGSYGFKHTDPDYPFAIRMKRFPDWIPGKEHLALPALDVHLFGDADAAVEELLAALGTVPPATFDCVNKLQL